MIYLAAFHAKWLLAAGLLGLAMGWVAVVHRGGELSVRWLQRGLALVAVALIVSLTRVAPGRFGYWLDLGLLLLVGYLFGCLVGSWLRGLLVARQRRVHGATGTPAPKG